MVDLKKKNKTTKTTFFSHDSLFVSVIPILVLIDYFTPAMLGLKMDQEVLGELVKVKSPKVWQTMMEQNVTWTLVVSRWFICLYIDVLPVEVSEFAKSEMDSGKVPRAASLSNHSGPRKCMQMSNNSFSTLN